MFASSPREETQIFFFQSLQERNKLVNKQIDQILADLKTCDHVKIFSKPY